MPRLVKLIFKFSLIAQPARKSYGALPQTVFVSKHYEHIYNKNKQLNTNLSFALCYICKCASRILAHFILSVTIRKSQKDQ
jgi:hypothetical protein